ncbi:hypothetical protein [Paraburkholderia phenoliruptrix]|nr:hypothetical protein [Paraburkholderia phenoliruptrix]MDR6418049.1 hypothetical protein [Paraburkholderia phenoliruptrix]CAB4046720.1 hypothetical protein LMG9964_00351 [Paraburkholderia phenoliruptrix]
MQFSYTTNGASEGSINRYGDNSISVSDGMLTVEIGDSILKKNINGAGVFEMKLLNRDLEDAKKLADLLCSPEDSAGEVPTTDLYTAKCDGKVRSSYVKNFSRPLVNQMAQLVESLRDSGIRDGRKLVKLDVSLDSIDRVKGGFLVAVRFYNGGEYPIKFSTPDKWDGGPGRDMLGVSTVRKPQFAFGLAGETLENSDEFTNGEVSLAPRSSAVLKMKTSSVDKFTAGTYDFNIGVFMNIGVVGLATNLSRVDFHSNIKEPTSITFDRDYPSTPEEREQWEARHRDAMSSYPVKPGQTFAEDGLYRAARVNTISRRSLQLVPFKAGAVATADNVKMLIEGGGGLSFDDPVQWLWEGSAPTPVKQYSFDMIEETRQFCEPGVPCPRSGRWVPRIRQSWDKPARYDLAGIVTLRRGQPMPLINDANGRADWEWVGA